MAKKPKEEKVEEKFVRNEEVPSYGESIGLEDKKK